MASREPSGAFSPDGSRLAGARGQSGAIGAEGYTHDGPVMSRQALKQRAISRVPYIDVTIFVASDQARAIGMPGDPADPGRVSAIRPPQGVGLHVPYEHALVVGSAG